MFPISDADDRLLSLQFISSDGEKLFFSGTKVSGGFALIGEPALQFYICEGFATGASLVEATGDAVVVAFSAGNLPAVARTVHRKFPNAGITIAADRGEAGIREGRRAAEAVGADIAVPEPPSADWNDSWVSGGAEAVLAGLAKNTRFDNQLRGRQMKADRRADEDAQHDDG